MFSTFPTVYFDKPGIENTQKTLELCIERLQGLAEKFLVISSTTGYSAKMAIDLLTPYPDIHLVVVGHRYGFKESGKNEIPEDVQKSIRERGYQLFLGTHAFTGLEKSFSSVYGGVYPQRLIADTLKIFSQGTKVLFEDMIMATDSGILPVHCWIVSAGGTSRGLDSAMTIKSVYSDQFFKTQIRDIICLPGSSN